MTRCLICDWSPSESSLSWASPRRPTALVRKADEILCDICDTEVQINLNQITASSPDKPTDDPEVTSTLSL